MRDFNNVAWGVLGKMELALGNEREENWNRIIGDALRQARTEGTIEALEWALNRVSLGGEKQHGVYEAILAEIERRKKEKT